MAAASSSDFGETIWNKIKLRNDTAYWVHVEDELKNAYKQVCGSTVARLRPLGDREMNMIKERFGMTILDERDNEIIKKDTFLIGFSWFEQTLYIINRIKTEFLKRNERGNYLVHGFIKGKDAESLLGHASSGFLIRFRESGAGLVLTFVNKEKPVMVNGSLVYTIDKDIIVIQDGFFFSKTNPRKFISLSEYIVNNPFLYSTVDGYTKNVFLMPDMAQDDEKEPGFSLRVKSMQKRSVRRVKRSGVKKRSTRRSVKKRSTRSGVKKRSTRSGVKKRSGVKRSVKKDDEKLKLYFRKKLKANNNDYFLPPSWIHPLSGKPAKVTDKNKRLLEEVKKELGVKGKRCIVKKSPTDNRKDLEKELKAYVKCWEKKTGRNQDLSDERLKNENLNQIKNHLKFYRENNDL